LLSSGNAINSAGQQQNVVRGVFVANCGDNRQGQGIFVAIPASFRPPYPTASPLGSMLGNDCDLACWTAREQGCDPLHHLRGQFDILFSSPLGSLCPGHGAFVGIHKAISLSFFERQGFYQDALPLVASP
jgi:hypothetical protein